jgi:outer membrane protein OmpA-like peptidoglycan-associated protein
MKRSFVLLLCWVLSGLWLNGCCAPVARVILLDNGQDHNAIVVNAGGEELLLDKPNDCTDIPAAGAPSKARSLDQSEIKSRYGELLRVAPRPPRRFTIYFNPDTTVLTVTSKKLLPAIAAAVSQRSPCEISVIGHTDRVGSRQYNIGLSLRRARQVAEWLRQIPSGITALKIESYGEEDPLIPTPDGVAEPRNRRVEIMIR